MKTRKQQDYNQAIDLISHLILKRPDTVISLLGDHGIRFREAPNRKELIAATVTMLKDTESKFIEDLGDLVTVHIQKNGKELLQLENKEYHAFVEEEEEDAFWGALAKGAIGIVGGLLGKKRRRRSSGGASNTSSSSANSAALAASRAESQRIADQSRRIQMDMQRQVQEMQRREQERQAKQQEEMRRLREEQRKREEEQKRQEEARIQKMKEEAKKSRNTILMVAGGVGGLLLIGIIGFVATKKPAAMVPGYAPPMPLTR